ncbi:DEAD/DEAH box helicase family protein [Zobellia galactanivorans]|uniref:EcoAI/FtnUII family type I restriction enzme subunit R n=1 Tax=Zobellia galactanivorans (strain DSM 12802 / CCUG 47099 / CIP 106680 / NCIMB 13871 / Dsij) TaxID=63186 RepID=UPI0026E1CD32|nr:type I restriction endonuclease subunit R [Zobellia galactanivorans]MDO6809089.1 DEAD/DEAH box helicase family protein [Zobellia galactanivorans]
MNEAQTKHDLIEPALRAVGWGVVEGSRLVLEFPITQGRILGRNRRTTPLKADYVLVYKNRRIGVVEAKARDKYYTDGLGQAKDYAQRLNIRFTYCTNGLQIYGTDLQEGTEGDVAKFPSPDELWEMTYPQPKEAYKIEIENWKERFRNEAFPLFKGQYKPRYYQRTAVEKCLDAIAEKNDRLLLTMATGTGKTATAFHLCWKLFHTRWNLQRDASRSPRILFLADRNVLADQAFNSFIDFANIDENILKRISPDEIRKTGKVPKNGSIFFTIFQTFMTEAQTEEEIEEDQDRALAAEPQEEYKKNQFNFGEYPSDFFDFIIIDECHRGGANDESSWREILKHFSPAVQLGLTATPKRDVNTDTYAYFGEPVYTYALKEGINDGFLTPFRVKQIQTNYDEYTLTGDDTIISGEAEIGDHFTYKDYGRKIMVDQIERFRVKKFLQEINQNHKTLVFCATQDHAAAIRDIINQECDSKNPDYCKRVTAEDGKIGEQALADFQDNEKSIPTVLTTSQKLSTGVDAPEVRNIVLLRPVNSMVEFKQIVGRGTRLFDGKVYFTIYDFVRAHHHFQDPEWDGEPLEPETPTVGTPRPCNVCGARPCVCEKPDSEPCPECENDPCVCETPPRQIVKVKLSDGKEREIDATVKTTFWSSDGSQISQEEFMQQLFGDITGIIKDEEELRKIWSLPSTRKKLLEELKDKGYTESQLEDLRNLIHAEDSDLFDVLSYVAYHKELVPRLERAEKVKIQLDDYNPRQQEFLNFVLDQYVKEGVDELDDSKLPELLELKYKAITDAKRELGEIKSIRETFIGFQARLYDGQAS